MTELPEPGVLARAVLPQARPAAADGDLQFGKSLAGLLDGADPGDRAGIVAGASGELTMPFMVAGRRPLPITVVSDTTLRS